MRERDRAPLRVLTVEGIAFLPNLSNDDATTVGRYWNAVRRYLETGVVVKLMELEGTEVAGMRLETRLAEIERHAIRGDVEFESIYGQVQ